MGEIPGPWVSAAETPASTRPSDRQRACPPKLHGGRYRMAELLGEGGMSAVFAAYDTVLERRVAIKILRVDRDAPKGVLAREARVLAAIQHPNVVTVHALHENDDPPFLVMEWLDGEPLDVVLRRRRLSLREALESVRQIADGLDAIHVAGLIHGDIKPGNIMVTADGRLHIIDVGLVPRLERMHLGEVLGTPAYMPPERALGTIATPDLAPRGDVYSFAVLAFELLAGRPPCADEPGGARPSARLPLRSPSDLCPLARVFVEPLTRATSPVPMRRHPSAGGLVDALERAALAVDPSGVTLRILVVDDDADMCAMMRTALATRLRGALIETASSGEAALESIRRQAPSAAVFDLAMPGLAGADLVRAALEAAPTLPVIVCTGQGSGPECLAVRELGVRSFLVKPVETDDLVHAIRAAIDPSVRPPTQRSPVP